MLYQPQFLCDGFVFPETPRWHRGCFYCCSIDEGTIFRIDEAGKKHIRAQIDDWLSGWVFADPVRDDIVLTSAKQRKLMLLNDEGLTEIADLSSIATWGLNDMIRTRSGVMFVGSVNYRFGEVDPSEIPKSPLIRVDAEGNVSVASDEVSFANGK